MILCCINYMYILEINPLLLANIFPKFAGWLFVLFTVFLNVKKLLSLIRSHLLIFVFISITLGIGSKKNLAAIYIRGFCLSLSLKHFIMSVIMFRSLIHFRCFCVCVWC